MRTKPIKYILGLAILFFVGYHSFYFKKLDEFRLAASPGKFNAPEFSNKIWKEQMGNAIANAIELRTLDSLLQSDPQSAFSNNSNSLSIGNYRYFLVKTNGVIDSVNEDDIVLDVQLTHGPAKVSIATEFIYGNAIRDASKLVEVKDFTNSKDLNDISAELNKIVKKKVVPPFKSTAKKGDRVEVVGAIEINKEHIRLEGIEFIPVQLKFIN